MHLHWALARSAPCARFCHTNLTYGAMFCNPSLSLSLTLSCLVVYDQRERDREGYLDVLSNDRTKCVKYYLYSMHCRVCIKGKEKKIAKQLWWDEWIMDTACLSWNQKRVSQSSGVCRQNTKLWSTAFHKASHYSLSARLRFCVWIFFWGNFIFVNKIVLI